MSKAPPPFLPYALPEIAEEEIAEVVDTLRSGWITTGPKTRRFEADFADFLGSGVEAIAVNSATAGLHLALEAIGIKPGDEVITTTHTFTATAEVIRYLGADPVFVDIDPDTLNICPDAILRAITPSTRAVLPVHFGGLGADMLSICRTAHEHGLHVVEDAAHALPTTINGTAVGALDSDATVFSFYANKTMTTGEGGMVVTRDPALAARARVMRLHGISRDAFDRFQTTTPSWYYEVVAPGYKYNMTDIAAAIGIHQLKRVRTFQARRAAIADQYDAAFADLPLILPPRPAPPDIHSWHLYVVRLRKDTAVKRDEFIARMFAAGIGCSVHYIPLHHQPYWKNTYNLNAADFPVSENVWRHSVSLPIYSSMTDDDVARTALAVRAALQQC